MRHVVGTILFVAICFIVLGSLHSPIGAADYEPWKNGRIYNQSERKYRYPKFLTEGDLAPAPLFRGNVSQPVDIIAHWYNDFGLLSTAMWENKKNGSYTWYDWSWNHSYLPGYDASRHPLIGWYRGDDPKVLDWICYWLLTNGVGTVSLVGDFTVADWGNPASKDYWKYVLFNRTPNFKKMRYLPWIKCDGTMRECAAQHKALLGEFMTSFPNFYTYTMNGRRFVCLYVWDFNILKKNFDGYSNDRRLLDHFTFLASVVQKKGYAGICLLSRHLDKHLIPEHQRDRLASAGVLLFNADYSTRYGSDKSYGYTYRGYSDKVSFPTGRYDVVNVVTSAESMAPHPSKFQVAGSRPEDFARVLGKAVRHVKTFGLPQMITVYNVSEWAEGGPGLIPNMRDKFGYLEAIRDAGK